MERDVYVIINEGNLVFASYDKDEALNEAERLTEISIADTAEENEWDLNDPNEYSRAVIQNGLDGGSYDTYKIRSRYLIEDTDYELPDGSYVSINDVLDLVGEEDEFDYRELLENIDDDED